MGAGHLSRPDFGKTQMDSQNPMSEFYECFLKGLEQGKAFAVPGCYARFKPDFSRQIYREDMPEYCTYSSIAGEGAVCVLEPAEFVIGQFELSLTARGVPMAVFIQSATGWRCGCCRPLAGWNWRQPLPVCRCWNCRSPGRTLCRSTRHPRSWGAAG